MPDTVSRETHVPHGTLVWRRGKAPLVSYCRQDGCSGARKCRSCRRLTHTRHAALSPEARKRANCRSYANICLRREKLIPEPCERCGARWVRGRSVMAHDDYERPLDVRWLCKGRCHREHLAERAKAKARA